MNVRNRLLTILALVLSTSCMVEKGEVNIKLPGAKNFRNSEITKATVTNVQIINDQLVITGSNLNVVTNIKTENASKSFSESFTIESKSNSQIIANSKSPLSFAVNSLFNLVLSNSYGAATFQINFSLCDATINGKGINCSVVANDKDVLSYDSVSDTWKPRQVNGLNYLGTFDASPGIAPTAQPSGSYYVISVSGTIGAINFDVGDWIVSNGAAYQKIDNSTAIISVFGRTGAVTGAEGDYSLDLLSDVDLLTTPPTAGKILKYNGTHWVVSDDLSSGGAGSVSSSEIADGAIATADLANASVTDAKINSIAASKITGTVNGSQIGSGVITNSHIAAGAAIDYSKLNITNGTIPYAHVNVGAGEIAQDRIAGFSTALSNLLTGTITNGDTTHAPTGDTVFDALGLKLNLTGGTLSVGTINGVPTPVNGDDIVNKAYVDSAVTGATTTANDKVSKTGDTMTGALVLPSNGLTVGTNQLTVSGGNVGIGTATPQAKLDVLGSVRLGDDVTACSGTNAGAMKFVTNTVYYCNGSAWTAFSFSGAAVSSTEITNGTIVDADINASANIAQSKIAGLTTDLANKQPLDSGLTNLAAFNTNGILVQSTDNTFVGRSIAGTANRLDVTNGDGVSGNPTLNISPTLLPSPTVGGYFLKSTGADASAWSALTSGEITTALGFTPVNKSGDTVSTGTIAFNAIGTLSLGYTPTNLTDATSKSYVDNLVATAANQWTETSGNVYRASGKVGIGTSNPETVFTIDTTGTGFEKHYIRNRTSSTGMSWQDMAGISLLKNHNNDSSVNTATVANEYFGELAFGGVNSLGEAFHSASVIASQVGAAAAIGPNGGMLRFGTANGDGSGLTTRMTIDNQGKVGIGTTSPYSQLEVVSSTATFPRGIFSTYYNNNSWGPYIIGRSAGGTLAVPTATLAGKNLASFSGLGYGVTGWATPASDLPGMNIQASEDWTDSNMGSKLGFFTITNGANTALERMTIQHNGNVGIGTTTPLTKFAVATPATSSNPNTRTVFGNSNNDLMDVTGRTGDVYLDHIVSATYTASTPTTLSKAVTLKIDRAPDVSDVDLTVTKPLSLWVEAGDSLFGGKIGMGNDQPSYRLDIQGNNFSDSSIKLRRTEASGIGAGLDFYLATDTTNSATSQTIANRGLGQINFYGTNETGVPAPNPSARISAYTSEITTTTTTGGQIRFQATPTGTNSLAEMMRIVDNKVGIGTTSPKESLDVKSGHIFHTGGDLLHYFNAYYDSAVPAHKYAGYLGGSKYAGGVGFNPTTGLLYFSNTSTAGSSGVNASINEKMVISKEGYVGIGTNSPENILHSVPTVSKTFWTNPGIGFSMGAVNDYQMQINTPAGGKPHIDIANSPGEDYDARFIVEFDNKLGVLGASVGIGTTNPSRTLYVNGTSGGASAWENLSDKRLKRDIATVDNALEKILQIDGVEYFWNKDAHSLFNVSMRKELGVIAQDVEKQFPEVVKTDDKGIKSVAYTMLISPMIEAIKSLYYDHIEVLWKNVNEHERNIASLKNENHQIKKDLDQMKKENRELRSAICEINPKSKVCR